MTLFLHSVYYRLVVRGHPDGGGSLPFLLSRVSPVHTVDRKLDRNKWKSRIRGLRKYTESDPIIQHCLSTYREDGRRT